MFVLNRAICFPFQAKERLHAVVQQKEGTLPPRWLLLEEEEGWQDDEGGPYEIKSARDRGKPFFYFLCSRITFLRTPSTFNLLSRPSHLIALSHPCIPRQ